MDQSCETSLILQLQLGEDPHQGSTIRLWEIYSPLVRRWLDRYDVQAADADDLIQDVLVVVLHELPSFEHKHQVGSIRRWLLTILVNLLKNFWRKCGRNLADRGSVLACKLNELEGPHSQLSRHYHRQRDQNLMRQLLALALPRFSESTLTDLRRLAHVRRTINRNPTQASSWSRSRCKQ